MRESPKTAWTMARFLDEEFGPPMLLRAARLVLEAQHITERLDSADDSPSARVRLREIIGQLEEQAQLHHWMEEDDVVAQLADLAIRDEAGVDLQHPLRAGWQTLETMLHNRLLSAQAQG